MATSFITNTASLKTTIADVRKLNAKKIFVGGENILDIIKRATPTIKHANDTRTTITEDDLWGQWVETTSDGTVIVHDDWITNPKSSVNNGWNTSITKVENNEAYVGDTLYANIQLEKIKNGRCMFYDVEIAEWNNDLPNLTNGEMMFQSCSNLTSFNAKMPNLTNGIDMFYWCDNLTSFNISLSSLTDGSKMFYQCSNLQSFTSDLPSLTNGYNMFYNCSKIITFSSDLSNLTNGYQMFNNCSKLTSFSSDLPSLTSSGSMFNRCTNLTSFSSDLSSLTTGGSMFYGCTNLTSFSSDLSSLTNGDSMFNGCSNLTSFTSDLSSLTNGNYMFNNCSKLTSFSSDLSSLTFSYCMFISCGNLTSFSSDLPKLTNGRAMFRNCENLESFSSELPSLTAAEFMFSFCKLNAESVMYIADTIKDITAEKQLYSSGTIPYVTSSNGVYSATKGFMSNGSYVYTYNNPQPYTTTISASNVGKLTLGINVTNNSSTIKQQLEDFAKAATFDSWEDLKTHFSNKGWTVAFQYGGSSDTITYDLRNGEQIIPCPIFAKLVQVEDKDSAEYCTEDASTFYNIEWGHDVTDASSYTQFNSLEDAMAHWNVFPKENIITSEEE